jgi:hypothetical protein
MDGSTDDDCICIGAPSLLLLATTAGSGPCIEWVRHSDSVCSAAIPFVDDASFLSPSALVEQALIVRLMHRLGLKLARTFTQKLRQFSSTDDTAAAHPCHASSNAEQSHPRLVQCLTNTEACINQLTLAFYTCGYRTYKAVPAHIPRKSSQALQHNHAKRKTACWLCIHGIHCEVSVLPC